MPTPRRPSPPYADAWVLQQRQFLGGRVRQLREDREWSQEHLAERAGLDRKTVSRVETASYGTSVDFVLLLARALNVRPGDLFR